MVNVFVLQLMCVLLQSQVYSVMNTAAYNKFCTEVWLLHPKLILSVSLLDTTDLDLDEVKEEENMQVDQTASADTLMVLLTLLSQAEIFFPGERVYYSLLRLKLFPQEQPTLSVKGGAPNPYLSPEKFVNKVFFTAVTIQWCSSLALVTRIREVLQLFCSENLLTLMNIMNI